jgi:tetratricopeptide (TPR) repeat protein
MCDITKQLRPGKNVIQALVKNRQGPPALWLCIEGADFSIRTDEAWTASLNGASECAAHLAGESLPFRPGNPLAGANRTVESFASSLKNLVLIALLCAALISIANFTLGPRLALGSPLLPLTMALWFVCALWVVLFVHNTFRVPVFPTGFDADEHLKYIQYIQKKKALPLAEEGFEMHQPPLFYALSAGLLTIFGRTLPSSGGLEILRLLGLGLGLSTLFLVAACMRLLFPDHRGKQIVGLVLAAFLPAPIYICHYITNESLLMMLGTAAIYLCLSTLNDKAGKLNSEVRVSRADDRESRIEPSPTGKTSWIRCLALGLCLGAALLTKVTALILVVCILLVLTCRLLVRRETNSAVWLRDVGLTLMVTILVSGWHYVRVWRHFGTPLVGSFDSVSGYRWWGDPGCVTLGNLLRFGHSLASPFFSGAESLPDGLYSTLWGDGLCGGVISWRFRPPWNYDLMTAGYMLALVPTLMIFLGLLTTIVQQAREPRATWFLLLVILTGLVSGIVFHYLRYPYLCHVKSIYGLPGLVTLSAFGANGLERIIRLGRVAGLIAITLLGTWASSAYASFWIQPASPATLTWIGYRESEMKHPDKALVSFRKAAAIDLNFIQARLDEAWLLAQAHKIVEVRQMAEGVLRRAPDHPEALLLLGVVNQAEGRYREALHYLKLASEQAPDHPLVYARMGRILMDLNRRDEAIQALRESLRVDPGGAPANHANLGILLAEAGKTQEALAQYRLALAFLPEHPHWNAELAWLLSTQAEPDQLALEEALRRSGEACRRTGGRDSACLEALAASLAALKDYSDALRVATHAEEVARTTGQKKALLRIEQEMRSYKIQKRCLGCAPLRFEAYPAIAPGNIR